MLKGIYVIKSHMPNRQIGVFMINKPKMILFDYGQTLVEEEKFNGIKGTEAILKYATQNKYGLGAEQVRQEAERINKELGRFGTKGQHTLQVEIPNSMFTTYLYESLGITIALSPEQIDQIFWDAASFGKPTNNIEAFLDFLYDSGIRTGVISNISYASKVVEDRICRLIPKNHFEFIIATSSYMYRKPNKRIFDLALEKASLRPEEVWYIGDQYECDIVGAKNAGIFPIWYTGAIHVSDTQSKDSMIVQNWKELEQFLSENTSASFDTRLQLSNEKVENDENVRTDLSKKECNRVLYVTDLDGTLLNREDRISKWSIDTINRLVQEGMLFTYATARSMVSASVVTKGLSMDIPVIAYNGALIIHPATGKILSQEKFSTEEIQNVVEVLEQYKISSLVYSYIQNVEKVSWIPARENEGIKHYLSKRQGDRRLNPVEDCSSLYQGEIFYFTCIGEQDQLQPIYDIFSKDSRFRCTIQQELYRPEYLCEIMPVKATKAEAIKKLKALWNCNDVISFGDSTNDIPMFEVSQECYAVANATSELKAVATGVIGSNEEDSVAYWLENRWNKKI